MCFCDTVSKKIITIRHLLISFPLQGAEIRGDPSWGDLWDGSGLWRFRRPSLHLDLVGLCRTGLPFAPRRHAQTEPGTAQLHPALWHLHCQSQGEWQTLWTSNWDLGLFINVRVAWLNISVTALQVQVIGSVVYSNYSVRVQVMPSPLVAFIQGGTNVFIRNRNTTVVALDGQRSYDPDFPMSPVRYGRTSVGVICLNLRENFTQLNNVWFSLRSFSWSCKPVSSIASSCFHRDVPTSFPVVTFPATFLKQNFDQFQFTLTIHSGERSASSETFLTLTANVIGWAFTKKIPIGQALYPTTMNVH